MYLQHNYLLSKKILDKQIYLFFETLKNLSKINETFSLFAHNFSIDKKIFSNNYINNFNNKEYGLNLTNIDKIVAI